MLSGMWRIKDYISSLLEGGHQNEPSLDDLQDIEAEVDRITQDMETERIRHQDSLRDNVRLYDENQTLKATVNEQRAAIEKLRKERDEHKVSAEEFKTKLDTITEDYNALVKSSTVIISRLKKVAYGKKGERLWKIVGKSTKHLFEGFVAMVSKNLENEADETDEDSPDVVVVTGHPNNCNTAPPATGTVVPTAPAPQNNGTGVPTAPAPQNNGTGVPTAPAPQNNGTGVPTTSAPRNNGTGVPTAPAPQNNGGCMPTDPRQGTTAGDVATAPSQENDETEEISDTDKEKLVLRRLKDFLKMYSSIPKYAFCFMGFGLTASEMMDSYGIDYEEQKLWLIAKGLVMAKDADEERAAERFKDKPFGHLIGRASYYPIMEYRMGLYFATICIVPEITHQGSTLAGRHSSRIFKSSGASPSSVAHVTARKYRQGLPYNALSNEAAREGANISRGLMASWAIEAYDEYLWIFHEYLRQLCVERHVLLMDETYGFAHGYEDESPQFYFWGMCTSPLAKDLPVYKVYFQDKTRYGLVAAYLLRGFKGLLTTDGYDGYEWLDKLCDDIILCSDWAHPRRKFVEVLPNSKILDQMTEEELKEVKELIILHKIARMFHLEKEYAVYTAGERLLARQGEMKLMVESVISICEEIAADEKFDPGSEAGKAVMYVLDRRVSLARLLEDGEVTLSTNEIERSNIILALERKRAKYFGSEQGARSAAGYFSIIESAEANGADPELFLEYLLTVLPYVLREHENEVRAYKEYLDKVRKILEDAKALHRKDKKAKIIIDWTAAGREPSLDFLSECLFDKDAFKAFVAMRKQEDEYLIDALIKAKTEFNFMNSPVSFEGMRKILNSSSFAADTVLDGARSILEGMSQAGESIPSQEKFYGGLIKNLLINDTPYPERLIDMLAERGLSLSPPILSDCPRAILGTDSSPAIPLPTGETAGQRCTAPSGQKPSEDWERFPSGPSVSLPGSIPEVGFLCPERPIVPPEGPKLTDMEDTPGAGSIILRHPSVFMPPPGDLQPGTAAKPPPA